MRLIKYTSTLLKHTVIAAVMTASLGVLPQAMAEDNSKQSADRIASLKLMASALRNSAEIVNAKRLLVGHNELDGSICKKGLTENCSPEESIKIKCGFPDASPDGILRALDADMGQVGENLPVPKTKWVYAYKVWDTKASQIIISLNGAPISYSFESQDDLTYKDKCYIFYNTPCFEDPTDSKYDGNKKGIQIRLFTDGC